MNNTDTINSLITIQGTDITKHLDHNFLCNLLIDCRDEIVQLKKALERIADSSNWGEDGCWDADSYPNEIAKEALGDGIWDADNYLDEIAEEELD